MPSAFARAVRSAAGAVVVIAAAAACNDGALVCGTPGGAGVSNVGAVAVDATDNWWGDVTGPHGPDGDGIAGAVLYVPFRTTQAMW